MNYTVILMSFLLLTMVPTSEVPTVRVPTSGANYRGPPGRLVSNLLKFKMAMETVPRELRGLRACLMCSLIKVRKKLLLLHYLLLPYEVFIFCLYNFYVLTRSSRLQTNLNMMVVTTVKNFFV